MGSDCNEMWAARYLKTVVVAAGNCPNYVHQHRICGFATNKERRAPPDRVLARLLI
jgi:hypothetical protein